jgi:antitoxin (DNA-binding transcriptional repressor) of toxin-antitoxin stability system
MQTVTAKKLHEDTDGVLKQVERGKTVLVTRNGHVVGKIGPSRRLKSSGWEEIMAPVWEAQKRVRPEEVRPNPVLSERARRRR